MILKDKIYTATKDYLCDACYVLTEHMDGYLISRMTFGEKRAIVKARQNKWKIKAGQKYNYQVNTYDGFCVFRSIPEILVICYKYELFDED